MVEFFYYLEFVILLLRGKILAANRCQQQNDGGWQTEYYLVLLLPKCRECKAGRKCYSLPLCAKTHDPQPTYRNEEEKGKTEKDNRERAAYANKKTHWPCSLNPSAPHHRIQDD